MEKITSWTARGHRLLLDLRPNGGIGLALQAQAAAGKDGDVKRQEWWASQLFFFPPVQRAESERQLAHWLSFFADQELVELGLGAFRDFFNAIPPQPESAAGPVGGNHGNLN